jgi:anti-anti-sigma factor
MAGGGPCSSRAVPAGRPEVPTDDRSVTDFAVAASFVGEQAVLVLHGEVDLLTAPVFEAFFDVLIDQGHRSVELDLAQVKFIDGQGLRTLRAEADRLDGSGGRLTIRSPSVVVRRLLDAVGLGDLIRATPTPSELGHADPSQSIELLGEMLEKPEEGHSEGMTQGLGRVTALHSDNEVVDGALRLAVTLARVCIAGADGVSVSLRRHGRLGTVAATDQTVSNMDANQYDTGEGPCIDASVEGLRFHAEALDAESRWPAFTPRARELGIKAILSSPLLVRDRPVGALNIYSLTPRVFSAKDEELARMFASEASKILSDAGVDVTDDQVALKFQSALRGREVIAQAQGVLMDRGGVTEDVAYDALRRLSLHSGLTLRAKAEDVVSSTQDGLSPRREEPFDV